MLALAPEQVRGSAVLSACGVSRWPLVSTGYKFRQSGIGLQTAEGCSGFGGTLSGGKQVTVQSFDDLSLVDLVLGALGLLRD